MSVRYRLFLGVSILFLLTGIAGWFIESFVTKRALKSVKERLYEKILSSKADTRKNLQEFVAYQILENQAQVDLLLNTLSFSGPQLLKFAPTLENFSQGTWTASADLLHSNRWLDFIQNTNEGMVTALIIPESPPFRHAFRIPIDQDLSWVFYVQDDRLTTPYVGVRLFAIEQEYPTLRLDGETLEESTPIIPETYLLFSIQQLIEMQFVQAAPPLLSPPWIEGRAISLAPFLNAVKRASRGLKEKTLLLPQMNREQIEKKFNGEGAWEEQLINPFPHVTVFDTIPKEQFLQEKMNDLSMRSGEVNILWMLISLLNSPLFKNEDALLPPVGVSTFKEGLSTGPSALLNNIFFSSKLFDDALYFVQNASKMPHAMLATSIALIHPEGRDEVYLGNTAQFHVTVEKGLQKRTGYLTLGCSADAIMQKLVLTLHQTVLLMSGGEAVAGFSREGNKIDSTQFQEFISREMNKKIGIVKLKGEEFFFMQVTPFPFMDLHFFLLNPAVEEFALLYSLEEGSQEVASSILLNIQICGFAVLLLAIISIHYFSRSVTAPIIKLARLTKEVKEGRLEQIAPTFSTRKRQDEISTLCQSFDEMVQGLKEKEKVKGILNKVVSEEIAKEILTGQVHLGGEEKRVTVLFADIRNFTAMTQHMQPHEVIDLLNTCMTKISACVDHQGGVIDKYVGDEAMALFGAPVFKEESAFNAVKSAQEMLKVLKEWNQERASLGLPPVEMGIGIHTGEMLVGNMGAENRLNYTVIGSNVNLAARICNAAKGMEILLSKDTLQEKGVRDAISYDEMPPVTLKGFAEPILLYRVKT